MLTASNLAVGYDGHPILPPLDIEVAAGEQMPLAEVRDTPYRYVEDDEVRAILATIGDHLVLTIAPASLDEEALARLLGRAHHHCKRRVCGSFL